MKKLTNFFIAIACTGIFTLMGCNQNMQTENSKTETITVEGMTCEGCESTIELSIKELDGIQEVKASHTAKNVLVTFDTLKVKELEIEAKIAQAGYEVK